MPGGVAERDCPSLSLITEADEVVFLGLTEKLAAPAPELLSDQASLCRIVCLWFCTDC